MYIFQCTTVNSETVLQEKERLQSLTVLPEENMLKTSQFPAFPLLRQTESVTMLMLCSSKQVLKIKHSDYKVQEAKASCHIVCQSMSER